MNNNHTNYYAFTYYKATANQNGILLSFTPNKHTSKAYLKLLLVGFEEEKHIFT